MHIVYHPDAKLVGDCRKMTMETLVTDLEYADDMALVSSSWSDLEAMIRSLNYQCNAMGLTISCKKTKTLAVLPSPSCQQLELILLSPGACQPCGTCDNFSVLGKHSLTGLQHWCRGDIQDFEGLTDLWITHAQAVVTTEDQIKTKLRVFSSVIFRTLLYGLQCTVLLEPEVHRLQSFVMRCLRTILSISTWDNKRNTSIRKTAKQQRVSSLLSQRRLVL